MGTDRAVGQPVPPVALTLSPSLANVTQVDGYSLIDQQNKTNRGLLFVSLKDFEERKPPDLSAEALIQAAARDYADIKEGLVIPLNLPSIPGLGVTAGFEASFEFPSHTVPTGTQGDLGYPSVGPQGG